MANFVNSQAAINSAYTHVGFLIDKSGSMYEYTSTVNQGVNELLKMLATLGGKRKGDLVLSEFSSSYSPVLNKPFSKLSKSPSYDFMVNGATCLYDSIVEIIKDVESNERKVSEKKSRVIVPILTDGYDSGCEITAAEVEKLINLKTEQGWQFILLGSDSSTGSIAQQIGIKEDLAITFDQRNMGKAIDFVGKKIEQVSKGRKLQITQQERLLLEGSSKRKTEL